MSTAAEPSASIPDPSPGRLSAGLPRFVVVVVGLASLAYSLTFIQGLKDLLAPVFLGLNLMIVAYPLQSYLVTKGAHRVLAALAALLAVLVVIAVFFGSTGWAASELLREIPHYAAQFNRLWLDTLAWLESVGITQNMLLDQLRGINAGSVVSLLTPLVTNISGVLALLATLVLAVFFLAMDSPSFERRLGLAEATHPGIVKSMRSFAHGVRRYWMVTTVFGLIVAVLDVVALAIIGVPLVWVWGVLAFLTNYIPNIGFVIGLVPPALLALLEGGPGPAIAVIAAYSILNFSVQSIIQPKFTGESVGVTPMVSFLSLLFWYWVLGWLGALLALPATLLLKAILVDGDPKARWVNTLISSRPDGVRGRTPSPAE